MSTADIIVRPARERDLPVMAELLHDLFCLESAFQPDRRKQLDGLSRLLADGGRAAAFVAECDGRVVAMATVQTIVSTVEGGPVGLVEDVIVDRAHRNRGIGTRLLDHLVAWSRVNGLRRLQLLADRGNASALGFYAGNGWSDPGLVCRRKMLGP